MTPNDDGESTAEVSTGGQAASGTYRAQDLETIEDRILALLTDIDEGIDVAPSTLNSASHSASEPEWTRKARHVLGLFAAVRRNSGRKQSTAAWNHTGYTTLEDNSPGPSEAVEFPSMETIGPFRLVREIGRGGCGVVYLAVHERLAREVALKIPFPNVLASDSLRSRFLREAKAVAALSHPNIVAVHETGEDPPVLYIASEYCPDGNLSQWLHALENPPSVRWAARLVADVADALAHAHDRGILHRDLKPGNILLQKRPTSFHELAEVDRLPFVPKVADFGLAKIIGESGDTTQSGMLIGTPRYMAPEQALGRLKEVGAWTDVYSMGVLLYELLTGRPPFQGETDLDTLRQLQEKDPPSLKMFRPGVPRDLEAVCLKCLEKDSKRRYATARDLAADLRQFLGGRVVQARLPGWIERGVKWVRRRPLRAALFVLLSLVAIGVPAALSYHNLRLQEAIDTADTHRFRAEQEQAEAVRQAELAGRNEERAQSNLYAAQMRLAWEYRDAGNLKVLPAFLDHWTLNGNDTSDPRGFEWRHLAKSVVRRQFDVSHFYPHSPSDSPGLLFMRSDGNWMLSAHGEFKSLWGRDSSGQWRAFADLPDRRVLPYRHVAVSTDGQRIAMVNVENLLLLYEPESGSEIGRSSVNFSPKTIALSPWGERVALAHASEIVLFDGATGAMERKLGLVPDEDRGFDQIGFTADGMEMIVLESNRSKDSSALRVVTLAEPDPSTPMLLAEGAWGLFHVFEASHTGRWLVTASTNGSVFLWDLQRMVRDSWTDSMPGGEIVDLAISPDDRFLAAADVKGFVRIWDIENRRLVTTLNWQTNRIVGLAFAPDGQSLAALDQDNRITFLPINMPPPSRTVAPTYLSVQAAVYSPKGDVLAIADSDGAVHLFDAARIEHKRTLPSALPGIRTLAFSPDGAKLAAGVNAPNENFLLRKQPSMNVLALCDLASGEWRQWKLESQIASLVFSLDGGQLAAGLLDGSLCRVRLDPMELSSDPVSASGIRSVAFTPDSRYCLASFIDQHLRAFPMEGGPVADLDLSGMEPSTILAVPQCQSILVASRTGLLRFPLSSDGLPDNRTLETLLEDPVLDLSMSSVGTIYLSHVVKPSEAVRGTLLDARSLAVRHSLLVDRHGVISADGEEILYGPGGNATGARVLNLRQQRFTHLPGGPTLPIRSLAFSPDGKTLASACTTAYIRDYTPIEQLDASRFMLGRIVPKVDGESRLGPRLRFWAVETNAERFELPNEREASEVVQVTWSPDGRWLLRAMDDGCIVVWDVDSSKQATRLHVSESARLYSVAAAVSRGGLPIHPNVGQGDPAKSISFSADGRILTSLSNRGVVRTWETGKWRLLAETEMGENCRCAAMATDGNSILASDGSSLVRIDPTSGQRRTAFRSSSDATVEAMAISADGTKFAVSRSDNSIELWNAREDVFLATLAGHANLVTSLAFTPDGKTLASGGKDATARLWSVAAAQEVAIIREHKGPVTSVVFSPDGSILATGSESVPLGQILLWEAPVGP